MSDTTTADPGSSNGDADAVVPFPSLPVLHATHLDLVRHQRESGTPPDFLADVSVFIQRGSHTR